MKQDSAGNNNCSAQHNDVEVLTNFAGLLIFWIWQIDLRSLSFRKEWECSVDFSYRHLLPFDADSDFDQQENTLRHRRHQCLYLDCE